MDRRLLQVERDRAFSFEELSRLTASARQEDGPLPTAVLAGVLWRLHRRPSAPVARPAAQHLGQYQPAADAGGGGAGPGPAGGYRSPGSCHPGHLFPAAEETALSRAATSPAEDSAAPALVALRPRRGHSHRYSAARPRDSGHGPAPDREPGHAVNRCEHRHLCASGTAPVLRLDGGLVAGHPRHDGRGGRCCRASRPEQRRRRRPQSRRRLDPVDLSAQARALHPLPPEPGPPSPRGDPRCHRRRAAGGHERRPPGGGPRFGDRARHL